MITIKDFEAFCDADPGLVDELACRECLTMTEAYARAHEAALLANGVAMVAIRVSTVAHAADHRLPA